MPKPDTEGRYEILNLHLRNKSVAPDVDLLQLARDLPGLVGADLANIVNEAQLAAVRTGRSTISARDMYAGVDRFTQVGAHGWGLAGGGGTGSGSEHRPGPYEMPAVCCAPA